MTHKQSADCVGYEVSSVVVMKSIIFWDMMQCSPLSYNQHFGGTYCLHLPVSIPEDGGDVPPKHRLQLNRLHGVISQKMILFKLQTVLTLTRMNLGDMFQTVDTWRLRGIV
jgi:hypothetical protein